MRSIPLYHDVLFIGGEPDKKEVDAEGDGFKRRRSVRRSIRLQQAEQLSVVSEERTGSMTSTENEGTNNDDKQGETIEPVMPKEGGSVLSTNLQGQDKTNTSTDESEKNDGERQDTDGEMVTPGETVSDTAPCKAGDPEDVIEQAPVHAVENLKKSALHVRRSTRRSLRLASAEDTQSLTTSEDRDNSKDTQERDTEELVSQKLCSTSEKVNKGKIDGQEDCEALYGSDQTNPVSNQTNPVSNPTNAVPDPTNVVPDPTNAVPDQSTPVSTSRCKSSDRRSLAKAVTSPEAPETAVTETTEAEEGKETSENIDVTQTTGEEDAQPGKFRSFLNTCICMVRLPDPPNRVFDCISFIYFFSR